MQQTEEFSKNLQTLNIEDNDTTMDLHITDILEQLTDLSSTLSHHTTVTASLIPTHESNVTTMPDHKLRINVRL